MVHEIVHAVRERLEAEFDRTHTVSQLAHSVGMSMFHFTRVFGELVGQTPHRYLDEVRLRAAHAMLHAGMFLMFEQSMPKPKAAELFNGYTKAQQANIELLRKSALMKK